MKYNFDDFDFLDEASIIEEMIEAEKFKTDFCDPFMTFVEKLKGIPDINLIVED